MNRFYIVLYDDDRKLYDFKGPTTDDTKFVDSVVAGQNKGLNIRCGTVDAFKVKSVDDLKKDGDPEGYRFYDGLFQELGIKSGSMCQWEFQKKYLISDHTCVFLRLHFQSHLIFLPHTLLGLKKVLLYLHRRSSRRYARSLMLIETKNCFSTAYNL